MIMILINQVIPLRPEMTTKRRRNVAITPKLFKDLTAGASARILRFSGLDELYRNRLMSLGLTPGTEFKVQHVAPLGDPVEIRVRGFHLSLRWAEAGNIEVELL